MQAEAQLAAAPALAGLRFRHSRGAEDAEALYAVHLGRMARDGVDPLLASEGWPSHADLQEALAKAAAEGGQEQWLITQVGERVVAYGRIASWPEADGTWVYLVLGWVLPEWRGKGIGTALLHWGEERSRRLAAEQHPGEKAELAANASSSEVEATTLLQHEGYRAAFTVLELALDPAALPPVTDLPSGISTRPVRPEHYALIGASVHEAYTHEYDEGRFNEDDDPEQFVASLRHPKHDPTLWQVAWDGDQITGQVLAVIASGKAEIFEVSVRPAWRRRALARGLLLRALHGLRERGVETIHLRTVAEFRTRARDLYLSVGFRVVKEFPRYRKPLDPGRQTSS